MNLPDSILAEEGRRAKGLAPSTCQTYGIPGGRRLHIHLTANLGRDFSASVAFLRVQKGQLQDPTET